jgi:hypothetical protein
MWITDSSARRTGIAPAWRWEPRAGKHRRFHEGVPQQFLDGEDMSTAEQHIGGERMAKEVRVDSLRDVRPLRHNMHELAEILRPVGIAVWERHEQRFRRSRSRSVPVQILDHQPGARSGDGGVPVFLPFPAANVDQLRRSQSPEPVGIGAAYRAAILGVGAGYLFRPRLVRPGP